MNILLGVTGSISAYKTPELVRFFVKKGYNVKVIVTQGALNFVSKLSLSVVSNNEVLESSISNNSTWNNHVELGLWANAFIVAPASANSIAKMANGICDNILLEVYLSVRCKTFVVPAMDHDMFLHKSTQRNIDILSNDGCIVIPPDEGELASGLIGKGRLPEPETIHKYIISNV
jgi:phosphopantothenoylcysteine decarboxylase/phosphopantothenate--cysteine ligase